MSLNLSPVLSLITIALVVVSALGMRQSSAAPKSAAIENFTKIEVETTVNAPVAEVWKCWATNAGAQTFFAPKTQIEPRPGGAFEIWFDPAAPARQRGAEDLHVLSALPGEMISFEWSAPPKFEHARPQRTWVVLTLTAVDDQHTRVRLVHLGWDEMKAKNPDHLKEWDEVRGYFEKAWPYVLGNLKRRFDEGPRWDINSKLLWKE